MDTTPLKDKVVWKNKITWEEVEDNFNEEEKKFYYKFPEHLKVKMYDDNKKSMCDGMQAGFMTDSDCVISTSISCCDLFDVMLEQPVSFNDADGAEVEGFIAEYNIEDGTVTVKYVCDENDEVHEAYLKIEDVNFLVFAENNELLEYDVNALLAAILRKAAIVRLASKGSPINMNAINKISLELVNEMGKKVDELIDRLEE